MDHGDEEVVNGGVWCGGGVMTATAMATSLDISKSHDIPMFAEKEDEDDALFQGKDAAGAAGRKEDPTSSSGSDGDDESSDEDSSSSGDDDDDDDDDGDNNKENCKQRSGDDSGPSEYEKLRLANIQRNRERLAMLGLLPLDNADDKRRKQPTTTSTKRKRDQSAFIPRRSLPRRRCAKIRHLPSASPTTAAIVPSRRRVATDAVSHRKAAAVVAAVPAGGTTIFDDYDNHHHNDVDENESVPSPVPITRTLKPQPHQATVDESHVQAYLKTRRVRRGRPKREEYDYGCDEVCAHCGGEWQFNNDYCLRPGSTCLTLAADDGDIEERTRLIRCKDCRGAFHLECMRSHGKEEENATIGDIGEIDNASQSTRDPIRCYRCDVQRKASRLSADSASSLLSSSRPFLLEAVIGDRTLMIRVTPEPVLEATIRVVKSDLELEEAVDDKHIVCSVTFGKETMPESSETEDEEDDGQLEDDVEEFMQGADANAIQALISNSLSNVNDAQTQDDRCILLRSYIKTEASAVAIVRMNGIQMLSKTLIIQRGTSCLDLTLAALVRHPVDAMVQQMACGLFRALSYNRDCCAKLNSKRVVLAVVDSIRRNTEELDVVMEARFV